jgi:hypothetical protein
LHGKGGYGRRLTVDDDFQDAQRELTPFEQRTYLAAPEFDVSG